MHSVNQGSGKCNLHFCVCVCAVPVPFAEVSNRSYFLCGPGLEKNNLLLLPFTKLLNQLELSSLFKSCDSVDASGTEIKTQKKTALISLCFPAHCHILYRRQAQSRY